MPGFESTNVYSICTCTKRGVLIDRASIRFKDLEGPKIINIMD